VREHGLHVSDQYRTPAIRRGRRGWGLGTGDHTVFYFGREQKLRRPGGSGGSDVSGGGDARGGVSRFGGRREATQRHRVGARHEPRRAHKDRASTRCDGDRRPAEAGRSAEPSASPGSLLLISLAPV
jgi:hypothetical protein